MNAKYTTFLFRWIAPLLVLGLGSWFVVAMGTRQKPKRKKTPPRVSIPVEVLRASRHTGPLDIVASGVAIPFRDVDLSAQVSGEVIFKSDSLSPGRFVSKGDLLLEIDPQDYQIEVTRLEQELSKSKLDLENVVVKQENTERILQLNREMVDVRRQDVERLNRLSRSNATSASETDAMRLAWLVTSEQLISNENKLRELTAEAKTLEMNSKLVSLQLQRAKLDLSRTKITAPFSGVVIATQVEQNASIVAGGAVATIEDTSMAEVRCNLRSEDVEFILQDSSGQKFADGTMPKHQDGAIYALPPVPVTVEYQRADRVYQWDGILSRQDGLGIDARTRTMPVRIRVSNPRSGGSSESLADPQPVALLRGMFVKVKLHCQAPSPLLTIPESVVRPGKTIWVMRDGKLQIEQIQIVRIEGGVAFVDHGFSELSEADSIISSPVPNARNGLAVSLPGTGKRNQGKIKKAPGKTAGTTKPQRKVALP